MKKKDEEKYFDFSPKLLENTGKWKHKLAVGTPVTGLVRIEWVLARYGQLIPTNWSMVDLMQWIPTIAPLRYIVSDAQNLIVKSAVEKDIEWLFLVEQDNLLPQNAFWRLNNYMRDEKIPVVSGLYFTKSNPPEPLLYRGIGNSYYTNWKMGDRVWVDGVPTGCLLVHMSILREMWNDSPEYKVGSETTRRVFQEPSKVYFDPKLGVMYTSTGTSDLAWCDRVRKEGYLNKAGWHKIAKKRYPFLVDTNLFTKHIDNEGVQYPLEVPKQFQKDEKRTRNKRKR